MADPCDKTNASQNQISNNSPLRHVLSVPDVNSSPHQTPLSVESTGVQATDKRKQRKSKERVIPDPAVLSRTQNVIRAVRRRSTTNISTKSGDSSKKVKKHGTKTRPIYESVTRSHDLNTTFVIMPPMPSPPTISKLTNSSDPLNTTYIISREGSPESTFTIPNNSPQGASKTLSSAPTDSMIIITPCVTRKHAASPCAPPSIQSSSKDLPSPQLNSEFKVLQSKEETASDTSSEVQRETKEGKQSVTPLSPLHVISDQTSQEVKVPTPSRKPSKVPIKYDPSWQPQWLREAREKLWPKKSFVEPPQEEIATVSATTHPPSFPITGATASAVQHSHLFSSPSTATSLIRSPQLVKSAKPVTVADIQEAIVPVLKSLEKSVREASLSRNFSQQADEEPTMSLSSPTDNLLPRWLQAHKSSIAKSVTNVNRHPERSEPQSLHRSKSETSFTISLKRPSQTQVNNPQREQVNVTYTISFRPKVLSRTPFISRKEICDDTNVPYEQLSKPTTYIPKWLSDKTSPVDWSNVFKTPPSGVLPIQQHASKAKTPLPRIPPVKHIAKVRKPPVLPIQQPVSKAKTPSPRIPPVDHIVKVRTPPGGYYYDPSKQKLEDNEMLPRGSRAPSPITPPELTAHLSRGQRVPPGRYHYGGPFTNKEAEKLPRSHLLPIDFTPPKFYGTSSHPSKIDMWQYISDQPTELLPYKQLAYIPISPRSQVIAQTIPMQYPSPPRLAHPPQETQRPPSPWRATWKMWDPIPMSPRQYVQAVSIPMQFPDPPPADSPPLPAPRTATNVQGPVQTTPQQYPQIKTGARQTFTGTPLNTVVEEPEEEFDPFKRRPRVRKSPADKEKQILIPKSDTRPLREKFRGVSAESPFYRQKEPSSQATVTPSQPPSSPKRQKLSSKKMEETRPTTFGRRSALNSRERSSIADVLYSSGGGEPRDTCSVRSQRSRSSATDAQTSALESPSTTRAPTTSTTRGETQRRSVSLLSKDSPFNF